MIGRCRAVARGRVARVVGALGLFLGVGVLAAGAASADTTWANGPLPTADPGSVVVQVGPHTTDMYVVGTCPNRSAYAIVVGSIPNSASGATTVAVECGTGGPATAMRVVTADGNGTTLYDLDAAGNLPQSNPSPSPSASPSASASASPPSSGSAPTAGASPSSNSSDLLSGSGDGIFSSLGEGFHRPIMYLGFPLAAISIALGLVLRWVRRAAAA